MITLQILATKKKYQAHIHQQQLNALVYLKGQVLKNAAIQTV
jgi:hypothetical protein